jgi:hypothetical protein
MAANHDISILTLKHGGAPAYELLDGRIPIHRVRQSTVKIIEHFVLAAEPTEADRRDSPGARLPHGAGNDTVQNSLT